MTPASNTGGVSYGTDIETVGLVTVSDVTLPPGTTVDPGPPSGQVRLQAATGAQLTLILLGDPDRSGGVGGWQSSERYGAVDGDWFKSRTKGALSLPCALDLASQDGPSLERRLAVLYGMGQKGDAAQPPAIRLSGDVTRSTQQAWKLDDVKLGRRLFLPSDHKLLRYIEVSLELSEFNVVTGIEPVAITRTRGGGGRRRRRAPVKTHRGDTLRAIAVRELGLSREWTKIRDANPKLLKHVDADQPLRAGLALKIPS